MKNPSGEIIPQLVFINYKRPLYDSMRKIKSSHECVKMMHDLDIIDRVDYKECFWVILLNRASCVLGVSKISEGSDVGTVANPKEIVQLALLSHATVVILVHNHPSGSKKPSVQDTYLTKAIQKTLDLFQIDLLDHIVITTEDHFSFSDEGILG